jgi:tetrahydromethanopterin S-methyltransferase subunit C
MLTTATYRKIVLGSAIYDLLVTAPFATPWSFAYVHAQLDGINQSLGGAALPAFSPFHMLFACLLGSVVLVWAALRIRDPQPLYGRYDGVARLLFTTWMIWTLNATGAPLLWLFIVPELAWGILQWLPTGRRSPVHVPG